MNLDNKNNNNGIIITALIMVGVASAFFLIVPITDTFIVAYVFALIGIALFYVGNLYLLKSGKSYPWFAAFPQTIWRYLMTQITVSAIFLVQRTVAGEDHALPIGLFVFVQLLVLALFAIFLLLMKSGKEIIETREAVVKAKVVDWRMLLADVESIKAMRPEQAKEIGQVAEAIKYSDPMSNDALSEYNDKIKDSVIKLETAANDGNAAVVSEICVTLLRQIKDRNNRVKLMK